MPGSDRRAGELFSYVDLEKRLRVDHPTACDTKVDRHGSGSVVARFCRALFGAGPAIDRARDAPSGDAAASVLLDPFRAAADGTVHIALPVRALLDLRSRTLPISDIGRELFNGVCPPRPGDRDGSTSSPGEVRCFPLTPRAAVRV
jgi:hypothetical protein